MRFELKPLRGDAIPSRTYHHLKKLQRQKNNSPATPSLTKTPMPRKKFNSNKTFFNTAIAIHFRDDQKQ
ncbi:MAG: hypothetical protein HC888_18325 [Candidatus Competibacteraceae bacterium]|nr:hypothetical protein [Candidatus Competibacteraceae bacterium]